MRLPLGLVIIFVVVGPLPLIVFALLASLRLFFRFAVLVFPLLLILAGKILRNHFSPDLLLACDLLLLSLSTLDQVPVQLGVDWHDKASRHAAIATLTRLPITCVV